MSSMQPLAVRAHRHSGRATAEMRPRPVVSSARADVIQRAPACACGGSCPRCRAAPALRVSGPGDAHEREADAVAAQVLNGTGMPVALGSDGPGRRIQRAARADAGSSAPAPVASGVRSASQPLDASTRAFMEPRFGYDFSHVRIHTAREAAETAARIEARAYTAGSHIVFGAGEYAPNTHAGRGLLAHELAHVVQQTGAGGAAPEGVVQRAPTISVLDENFIGPPSTTQRRAARSCPIGCGSHALGTLHSMGLFYHTSRTGTVAAGSAAATGVGTSLHFMASGTQPAAGDACHCDGFNIIQVLETTHPAAGRGNSYVDNNAQATPFYSDVYLGGAGEHAIPAGYPDAGERVDTTRSIYDRPYRDPATLGGTDLSWMAEACVACVKNAAPDRMLGCVSYGFTRAHRAAGGYDPVVGVGPSCRAGPSGHFLDTLRNDPSVSGYDFQERRPMGDFPMPPQGVRYA